MANGNLETPKQTIRKRNYYLTKIVEKELIKEIKETINEAKEKADEILKNIEPMLISPAPPRDYNT